MFFFKVFFGGGEAERFSFLDECVRHCVFSPRAATHSGSQPETAQTAQSSHATPTAPKTHALNTHPNTNALTCTAKSHMMMALRSSSHQASNRSRLSPDCSMEGVAMTTQGPVASNCPAPLTTRTWRKEKGLPSCWKACLTSSFIISM